MDDLITDGWGALDAETLDKLSKDQEAKNLEQMYEFAHRIAAPFLTQQGKICLAALKSSTLDKASTNGMDAKANGYSVFEWTLLREGQNSLIRYIEDCIKTAMEGPKPSKTRGRK